MFYLVLAILNVLTFGTIATFEGDPALHRTVAIFGASGTAGDGVLKAALADPDIDTIHVITRRSTPRIDRGIAEGKVRMTLHMDYLDYSPILEQLRDVDAVYWALGTSSIGVDEETYGRIHVDFPVQFIGEWLGTSRKPGITFHYISSSDISEDSSQMWARQKVRAENELFAMADGTELRVIAYRPDYIGPTAEDALFGQDVLFWTFRPVRAAVRALEIGKAMLEVTARRAEFENGDRVGTGGIIRYSEAYDRRRHTPASDS